MVRIALSFAGFLRIFSLLLSVSATASALPVDSATLSAVSLYGEACLKHIGAPEQVRGWAESKHFLPLISPAVLSVFTGPGKGGAAWIVPTPATAPHLTLSLRSANHACAVWADTANVADIMRLFSAIANNVAKYPGLTVSHAPDRHYVNKDGVFHTVLYTVRKPGGKAAFYLLLLIAEEPTPLFQVSLQVFIGQ